MSAEEKITSNPKTIEPPKPKRRFKLDKKHIQGFIAGILLCVIAFTGLYYGTDGRFFKGMSRSPIIVDTTDAIFVTEETFEDEVLKSEIPVLVVFYSPQSYQDRELFMSANYIKQYYNGELKFVFVNTDEERILTNRYYLNDHSFCLIFKEYQIITSKKGYIPYDHMANWLQENRSSFVVNHKYVTDDTTFENEVLKSTLPVFVYEYSMSDYRCIMEQSRLKYIAPEYKNKIKFILKPRLSDGYSTYNEPIYYIYKDGKVVDRTSDFGDISLQDWLKPYAS